MGVDDGELWFGLRESGPSVVGPVEVRFTHPTTRYREVLDSDDEAKANQQNSTQGYAHQRRGNLLCRHMR